VGDPSPPDPAQPDPAQPAPAVPAGAGTAAPARGGNSGDKSGISGALIGASGAVLAALIGGLFLVFVTFHHGGSGGGGGSTTQSGTPTAQASGPVHIQKVTWLRPVNGLQAVSVTGTEQGLTGEDVIFAVAGHNENTPPFYSSIAVSPHINGIWSASITEIPASVRSLTFWPTVGSSAVSSSCSLACAATAYARDRQEIAGAGPHAAFLKHVGPPVQSHAPSG